MRRIICATLLVMIFFSLFSCETTGKKSLTNDSLTDISSDPFFEDYFDESYIFYTDVQTWSCQKLVKNAENVFIGKLIDVKNSKEEKFFDCRFEVDFLVKGQFKVGEMVDLDNISFFITSTIGDDRSEISDHEQILETIGSYYVVYYKNKTETDLKGSQENEMEDTDRFDRCAEKLDFLNSDNFEQVMFNDILYCYMKSNVLNVDSDPLYDYYDHIKIDSLLFITSGFYGFKVQKMIDEGEITALEPRYALTPEDEHIQAQPYYQRRTYREIIIDNAKDIFIGSVISEEHKYDLDHKEYYFVHAKVIQPIKTDRGLSSGSYVSFCSSKSYFGSRRESDYYRTVFHFEDKNVSEKEYYDNPMLIINLDEQVRLGPF